MNKAGIAWRAAVCGTVAALSLAACGGDDSGGADASGDIKLGVVTSSAGPFAANFKTMTAGIDYAVKAINGAGGVDGRKIVLTSVDTQNNPTNAATAIPQLATRDKVVAIVGPVDSAGCEVACAAANKLKVPIVSPGAGRPGVLKNSRPYGFTLAQPDADNSTGVLVKAVQDKGIKTAAIISDEANATTKAQSDLFTKVFADAGVTVVKTATFKTGDSSFASQITSLKAANPQALALAAGPEDAGRIAKEARSQGMTTQFLGAGALQSGGAAYVAAGGTATEGTISAAQYDAHSVDPATKALQDKAATALGVPDVPLNFAYAYDAVNMIVKVLKEKASSGSVEDQRVAIQEGLNAITDYKGMADTTTFKEDGTGIRPQLRSVVKDGAFTIDRAAS